LPTVWIAFNELGFLEMSIPRLPHEEEWKLFGDKLRVARALANKSLRDVGAEIGVSAMAISKWEAGRATPESSKLVAIAKLYDVSLDWIMCSCPITIGWHHGECAEGVKRRAEMTISD